MLRVLIIDPWGMGEYLHDFVKTLSQKCDVSIMTTYNFDDSNINLHQKYIVFQNIALSSRSKILQRVIKGISYLLAWFKICFLCFQNKYDIIHIQWLLCYPMDIIGLKILKNLCKKLIFTAHNAIPHIEKNKQIKNLNKIYKIFDVLIVHGETVKKELLDYFPKIQASDIYIHKHGAYSDNYVYDLNIIDDYIRSAIEKCQGKVVLFQGIIFQNKGVDRILRFWIDNYNATHNDLLIVAGIVKEKNSVYIDLENKIPLHKNILYLPRYINSNELNYLFSSCHLVVLPYYHASMSGVIFSAAKFKKTVLTTDVGCIPEYVINNVNSYISPNEDIAFADLFLHILLKESKKNLKRKGEYLAEYIEDTCNWEAICFKLIQDVYSN